MKQVIRRCVFETNSSSVHTLSIIKNSDVKEYPSELLVGTGDFGWEDVIYNDTYHKAAYFYKCLVNAYDTEKEIRDTINTFVDILKSYGVYVKFKYPVIEVHHSKFGDYFYFYDEDGHEDDGYVDHVGDAKEFVKDCLANPEKLMNFLFDDKSFIVTGNDNEDSEIEIPDYGESWEFIKGN